MYAGMFKDVRKANIDQDSNYERDKTLSHVEESLFNLANKFDLYLVTLIDSGKLQSDKPSQKLRNQKATKDMDKDEKVKYFTSLF